MMKLGTEEYSETLYQGPTATRLGRNVHLFVKLFMKLFPVAGSSRIIGIHSNMTGLDDFKIFLQKSLGVESGCMLSMV